MNIKLHGKKVIIKLQYFEKIDKNKLKRIYKMWLSLSNRMKKLNSRGANIPEILSEGAFCLKFNSARVLKVKGDKGSFDTLSLKNYRRQQIKATSIEKDLTSFGPKSVWDDLYFLDFYNNGNFNGNFKVYKIANKYIFKNATNKKENFKEQQKQKRRPRFCIKEDIIKLKKIKPIKEYNIFKI